MTNSKFLNIKKNFLLFLFSGKALSVLYQPDTNEINLMVSML